mgnify:CR=1 FL=1
MAREVKVNLDMLDDVRHIYSENILRLEEANNRLNTAIEVLRNSKWKTDGARAFLEVYDGENKPKLAAHISHLKHLNDCLDKASKIFHTCYETKI